MRIVIDLTALADNFSGLERYALNISLNLVKNDDENNYILLFKNNVFKDFSEVINKKNVTYKVIKGKNKLIFNQIILPMELLKIKADKYLFLAFPNPIIFRRKGIYNAIHDLTAFYYPETMKKSSMLYFKYSILNAVRVSEGIITVSKTSKADIEKTFKPKKINVFYNGISSVFEDFNFNNEKNDLVKDNYNLNRKYIMCLGTLEPRKNLTLMLKAYSQLKRENKINEKLVLVGRRGWKIDELLKGLDILDQEEDIIFTGFVEDEYLPYLYLNCEAFVFPSIYEGFGIPAIEAMYMEAKVLLSDIPVLKEVCGENVKYFESNNINSLKNELVNLLNDKNYDREINKERVSLYKWKVESEKIFTMLIKEQ